MANEVIMAVTVLIPVFTAFFMLLVSWILPGEKYPALKIGLILVSFVFIIQAYNFSTVALGLVTGDLIDTIGTGTELYTWVYIIVFSIILITFIYDVFMMFSGKKYKTGEEYEDEQR